MPSSASSIVIVSKCTIQPQRRSDINSLKLSVSDLPMLSCHYIQKGVLLPTQPQTISSDELLSILKLALSRTLSYFPALAGRLKTDASGHVHIICNGEGVDFFHGKANGLQIEALLPPPDRDIPVVFSRFFQLDHTLSYDGHTKPLLAVQVTQLNDGVFIGCTANHAVVDGTSFWNFFNTFAEMARGANRISKSPEFGRETPLDSSAVLPIPDGGPLPTFSVNEPLRQKIFHFSREAILKMKLRSNNPTRNPELSDPEILGNGKQRHDSCTVPLKPDLRAEISSFQSLCAQLWRSVTRARNLTPSKTTTFRMAVNCRHRLEPRLATLYFGNAIQSIPTSATAGELLLNELSWGADKLHKNVIAHDDATVRRGVKDWESNPHLFPLGNFDGAMITMGSSPRFPMYDNDFGWGRPLAVRSGGANKFDGKISAFPGSEGNGSVDLEVVLAPETMSGLENDREFMQYVS